MTKIYKNPTPLNAIMSIIDGIILVTLVICFFPVLVIFKVLKNALI